MFSTDHYYSRSVKTDGDAVQVFSLTALGLEGGERLTRGSLILIALLAGGDYDQVKKFYMSHNKLTYLLSSEWYFWLRSVTC